MSLKLLENGVLPDYEIQKLAEEKSLITPYSSKLIKDGCVSWGQSSYGYDARLGNLFMSPSASVHTIIDPKNPLENQWEKQEKEKIYLQPGSFVLGHTVEYFKIPEDMLVLCIGKSTYARCGVNINVTPLEPGWEGQVTLEINNTSKHVIKIYANEGICQFIFIRGAKKCRTSYRQRAGKYQGQRNITLGKI